MDIKTQMFIGATILFAIYIIFMLRREGTLAPASATQAPTEKDLTEGEDEEDEDVLVLIQEVTSLYGLRHILEYYFDDIQSTAFLEKILPYEKELNPEDWRDIYLSAEQGSKLQEISHQRMRA